MTQETSVQSGPDRVEDVYNPLYRLEGRIQSFIVLSSNFISFPYVDNPKQLKNKYSLCNSVCVFLFRYILTLTRDICLIIVI